MDERAAAVNIPQEAALIQACVCSVCACRGLVGLRGLHYLSISFPFKAISKVGLSKVSKGESFGLRSQPACLDFLLLPLVPAPPGPPPEQENRYVR